MQILIRIKAGHQMSGEGEKLGRDLTGELHTFWKSTGHMEVPQELAISLERERPQRFEIVDRELAKKIFKGELVELSKVPKPIVVTKITLKELDDMTKDELNDYAAKRDYDLNPGKEKKQEMIDSLIKQIENKTGKKVV